MTSSAERSINAVQLLNLATDQNVLLIISQEEAVNPCIPSTEVASNVVLLLTREPFSSLVFAISSVMPLSAVVATAIARPISCCRWRSRAMVFDMIGRHFIGEHAVGAIANAHRSSNQNKDTINALA